MKKLKDFKLVPIKGKEKAILNHAREIRHYCQEMRSCEECVFYDSRSREEFNHCLISEGLTYPQHWRLWG